MAKYQLSDVKAGSLVGEIHEDTVEFYHKGELCDVDIKYKILPFVESDALHKRMNNNENVAAEWISKALVDGKGKQQFTEHQVKTTFIQPLANAIFNIVWGLDSVKKAMEKTKDKKE
ncbi:phage tail assembly chaperone family protein, TAC [Psychrobacter sp. 28M-43]|uniref:phage tail assembly chaperone family protein, TAC n=1 Tax=Psychrobacter sp. 28M-43 TaxID=2772254 RepID=UPI00168D2AF6|nr:phage tail assembly chaperone family protein, TAC [Psychrobacter sp. 28M-43]QOD13530.1 phage tail assembly chaperone family protein, TAC [Psychrobacter sp. 28M-43]